MQDRFLENDEIRLRAIEPSDAELMWEIETDSTQWRENGMMAPYSRKNLIDYADNYDADPVRAGQVRYVAEFKSDRKVFGLIDLYDISPQGRTAFIGFYIIPEYRGKGLAMSSVKLMEDYACRLLNLRILAAKVSELNSASISIFESSGYKKEANLTDWLLSGKRTASLYLYTKHLEA